MNKRKVVLEELAELILAVQCEHPVRVAIDGVDAAGKTTLADELRPLIEIRHRPVIRASIDGFHNPKEIRYRQGVDSPQGYYEDSFNDQAITSKLLIPLGPGGTKEYLRMVYDYRADAPTYEPRRTATQKSVLLFDGVFLLRPELVSYWDFRIFIDADFSVSVLRAIQRDLINNPDISKADLLARYRNRYVPGQRLYFSDAIPEEHAHIIFGNNNYDAPNIEIRNPKNKQAY